MTQLQQTLEILKSNAGKVVAYDQLALSPEEKKELAKTALKVRISRLRSELPEGSYIASIRGVGYMYTSQNP